MPSLLKMAYRHLKVLTDDGFARKVGHRLGRFTYGPVNFFPANWPVSLTMHNKYLLGHPYIVRVKPQGTGLFLCTSMKRMMPSLRI